jgi:restriction endonuclease S subunit
MLIPIPPFTEQKAIVAKIEKLMEHVFELEEKIKQNKQDAEMLMQSFLVEAFKN